MATRRTASAAQTAATTKPQAAAAGGRDDALTAYRNKRDFSRTSEPAGGGRARQSRLRFVVQKHWASQLHYDLRLELDGSMKSWAVPKGPSLDPQHKRMAVQVEDHPIAYNSFEGEIPKGQYGAGKVIVWDAGTWVAAGDAAASYRAGKLKFQLHGHKLQGGWTLVRMHGHADDKQPPWLLIKERDGAARPASAYDVLAERPDSVKALGVAPAPAAVPAPAGPAPAKKKTRTADGKAAAAERVVLPATLAPQLATLVDAVPADAADWSFEPKLDGYRLLARIDAGHVQLFTRNGKDWTGKLPELAAALCTLPLRSAWLDGEILVFDHAGAPDFQALQNAFDTRQPQDIVYVLFDLPFLDGQDLRALPLTERRDRLRQLLQGVAPERLRFSESLEGPVPGLLAAACKAGLEGVIGKRRDAAYVSRRSADWIKLKCGQRQEFVVGGYTDPQGSRSGLGALLLGVHDAQGVLRFAGNVGTGFSEATLLRLRQQLEALHADQSPFGAGPLPTKRVHWVQPRLLAEVSFAQWTKAGQLRHAVFHALRSDKPARAIVREQAQPVTEARAGAAPPGMLRVSHPERVVDAASGVTKMDLVRYYASAAELLFEHLQGRPVALVRAPSGVDGPMFFQKHEEGRDMPGLRSLDPALDPGHAPLMEAESAHGLVLAIQMNVVEFHTWNASTRMLQRPDRITFDLDPGEGVPWKQVQEGAQLVHALLDQLGLPSFLKTSGGKGLHVVVPIKRLHDWDTVKAFTQAVAAHLAATIPQRFVVKSGPRNRVGKIFVDYLRNGWGATTVAAWSARARPGMGVSVPVSWSELGMLTGGAHWTVQNIAPRLAVGNQAWKGYAGAARSITAARRQLESAG